jgi:hypothetical protein
MHAIGVQDEVAYRNDGSSTIQQKLQHDGRAELTVISHTLPFASSRERPLDKSQAHSP